MNNTRLRLKRSERGEALVVTISIIGLAIIVTAAAFLLRASMGQDTERVASAKVDIATREDTLMRAILQQAATGMLPSGGLTGPSLDWTTIMTQAVNQVAAATYVDPNEASTLLGPGVIPANTGDPDDGSTPLSIFQGYNQEVPFGGTTGLPNVDLSYNANVEPAELAWVANPKVSATTAITNPQQFFLGSQVSAAGTSNTSASGRWGLIPYPNIRFGLMRPGDKMVARRVWWRIPVYYQTALKRVGTTTARYPAMAVNYILSVYEIPSQLPIMGNAKIELCNTDLSSWGDTTSPRNQVQITGSIYGDEVQLNGGTFGGGISSRRQVNVASSTSVAGETFADNTYNDLGVRETKDLTRAIGAAPVSVAGDNGKVLMVPVLTGTDFYLPSLSATPSNWDLYARPYYRCRIRVIISNTDSKIIYDPSRTPTTDPTAGAITVKIIFLLDTLNSPDQILGFPDSAAQPAPPVGRANTVDSTSNLSAYGMSYTTTVTGDPNIPPYIQGHNVLVIDVKSMVLALGKLTLGNGTTLEKVAPQLYSIYIGSDPTTTTPPDVAITGTNDLSAFTSGLSIVTSRTLYLFDSFNQGEKDNTGTLIPGSVVPTSLYAPQVRYGGFSAISATNPQVNLIGSQVAVVATPGSPLRFTNVNGDQIGLNNTTARLTQMPPSTTSGGPLGIPPITALNLLFTIEKERTN
jgi:hypothetical protein